MREKTIEESSMHSNNTSKNTSKNTDDRDLVLDRQDVARSLARASLRQTLVSYSQQLRSTKNRLPNPSLEAQLEAELTDLKELLEKLDRNVTRLAVFGLVSRGKSALINALLGDDRQAVGPLNGVTQNAQILPWTPEIELIDTPGLDEIEGEARAEMATQVAKQSDLILFVISGAMTQVEFQALCQLRSAQKPLILVFNKSDLYPHCSVDDIYESLADLESYVGEGNALRQMLTRDEIVFTSASPAPTQVRVQQPNGDISFEWEPIKPDVEALKTKIEAILKQEGRSLVALNALTQARSAEERMVKSIVEARSLEAEAVIWRWVRVKAIAVAANPIPGLDWLGGTVSDLLMIRELGELYGFPLTRYEAGKLLTSIATSSIGLLLSDICSNILLSTGKAVSVAGSLSESPGLGAYVGVATAQAGVAGYGAYVVGRAAQTYLERGCTWGAQGSNTVIQELLEQIDPKMIIWRLRSEY